MNIRVSIKISAIIMALFLFIPGEKRVFGLPVTETIYMIPEDEIELTLGEELWRVNDNFMKERFGLGFGVLRDLSLWLLFEYVHQGVWTGESEMGDAFLKIRYYLGDYNENTIHMALLFQFRIPTGKDAYHSGEWRNVALGNNEFKFGLISQFDIFDVLYLHFNLLYVFREGDNEDFYGGFYLNPVQKDTYVKLFGFNPFSEGAFFYKDRLKNDYMSAALACNTDSIYPVIPYIEVYGSFRLYRGGIDTGSVRIEAAGVDPVLLLSGGIRYFFSESVYLGLYAVVNPLRQQDFIKEIYGLDFGVNF
ncbi:MAG: hypothetical protein GY754_10205 [bacterium]|nr:hypothetical protein [bacterium]